MYPQGHSVTAGVLRYTIEETLCTMNIDTFNLKRGFYSGERMWEVNKFRQKSECSLLTIGYYVVAVIVIVAVVK